MKTIDKLINDKLVFFEGINQEVIKNALKDKTKTKIPFNKFPIDKAQIKLYNNNYSVISASVSKLKKSSKSLNSTAISTGFIKYNNLIKNKASILKSKQNNIDYSFTFHPEINKHSREITSELKPSYDQPIKSRMASLNKSGLNSLREYSPYYKPKKYLKDKDIIGKVFLYHKNIFLKKETEKNNREKHVRSLEKDYREMKSKSPKRFSKEKFDKFINLNNKKIHHTERMLFEKRKIKEYKEQKTCTFKPLLSHLNISVDESNIKHQIPYINDYVKLKRGATQFTNHNKSYINTSRDIKVSQRKYVIDNHFFIFK